MSVVGTTACDVTKTADSNPPSKLQVLMHTPPDLTSKKHIISPKDTKFSLLTKLSQITACRHSCHSLKNRRVQISFGGKKIEFVKTGYLIWFREPE
jgi:hypothetical protein